MELSYKHHINLVMTLIYTRFFLYVLNTNVLLVAVIRDDGL